MRGCRLRRRSEWIPHTNARREDVFLAPAEDVGGPERYIVAVDWHHFVVDHPTACLISALRTQTSYDRLVEHLHKEVGEKLDVPHIRTVVETRLPPQLFHPSAGIPHTPFSWQYQLISGRALETSARIASGLFRKPVALAFFVMLIVVDAAVLQKWFQIRAGGWHGGFQHWPMVMMWVLLGVLIHELGHVSALRRFGRKSGGIGCGIYWIFPTFYADVSETWRLPRKQRAIVDVGGLYFQGIYMIAIGFWALASQHPEIPILVMWTSHLMMLYTLNPTLKFDGYWLLTDLTGLTNLHSRVAASARQLVSRLRGDRTAPPLMGHQAWLLGAFSLGTTLYFGYVFLSLGAGLAHVIAKLLYAPPQRWFSFAGMVLTAIVLGIILVTLMRRCIKVARTILD